MGEELVERVQAALRARGFGPVVERHALEAGMQSTPVRWRFAEGPSVVVKTHATAPVDWFTQEAAGLVTLREHGMRVPTVVAAGEGYLVLEDLGAALPEGEGSVAAWEAFGRSLAGLHRGTAPRFGWETDNYLGIMPQRNAWADDGVAFFVEHRALRYLSEPGCERCLTADDRRGVERLLRRLEREAPREAPALLHGDLHCGNVLARSEVDEVVTYDPAVYYGLREAELSLVAQFGGFPEPFWRAYEEAFPLADGWRERLGLYEIKEYLGLIAQFGEEHGFLPGLRDLLARV